MASNRFGADKLSGTLAALIPLWSFKTDLTKGRPVGSIIFNPNDPNILAVAYGESPNQPAGGLVLCWSLKNIEYPERIYSLPTACTAIGFSSLTPNLLAVGSADGRLCVYDVQQPVDSPILTDL